MTLRPSCSSSEPNECRRSYGRALIPTASIALAKPQRAPFGLLGRPARHLLNPSAFHGLPSLPGNTGASSPGRPDTIRHAARSAPSVASSRTLLLECVLGAPTTSVRCEGARVDRRAAHWPPA